MLHNISFSPLGHQVLLMYDAAELMQGNIESAMDRHNSFKEYYLSIIDSQWRGIFPDIIKGLLFLASYFYRVILGLRQLIYQKGFIKKTTLSVPVISIGNITLGGSGKTPLIEYTAVYLKNKGKNAAILSRGYGAKKKRGGTNQSLNKEKPSFYNDEYLMLRENLGNTPNLINKDRVLSGKRAIEEHHVDCLLLDDGFQHLRLDRSLDIVIINSLNPFGYEMVFPRGFLREPLQNLQRADLFIIAHSNLCSHDELERLRNRLSLIHNKAPIAESIHQPLHIENISDETILPVEWLNSKRIYAFCAIGSPESFSRCLSHHGALLIKLNPFLDHYFYSKEELEKIIKEAEQLGADAIITTQKDKVKVLEALTKEDLRTYSLPLAVLKVAIKIVKGREIFEKLIDDALVQRIQEANL